MAKKDKFGWYSGRGAKQKVSKIVRMLNESFSQTGGKYTANLLRWGRIYYPSIEKVRKKE